MASVALRQGLLLASRNCPRISKISQGANAVNAKFVQRFVLAPLNNFSSSAGRADKYQDELLQKQMANDNPFDTYVTKPETGRGLFEGSPVLVPSTRDSRMVGCCCEDDYQEVVWFELKKGPPQRCDCGNYFKLIDYDPLDPSIKAKFGGGFGSGLTSVYY